MKKTKLLLFLLVISLISTNVIFSQNGKTTQTTVDFKIRNLGFNVDGYFKEAKMNVVFNENDLSQSSISGKVAVKSIDTDIEKRDLHLKQEEYFDADNYPNIIFESSKITLKSQNTYNVTGKLTIKNVTKDISIPAKIKTTATGLELSVYFEIDRRDYNVGSGSLALSDTAKITITYLQK